MDRNGKRVVRGWIDRNFSRLPKDGEFFYFTPFLISNTSSVFLLLLILNPLMFDNIIF